MCVLFTCIASHHRHLHMESTSPKRSFPSQSKISPIRVQSLHPRFFSCVPPRPSPNPTHMQHHPDTPPPPPLSDLPPSLPPARTRTRTRPALHRPSLPRTPPLSTSPTLHHPFASLPPSSSPSPSPPPPPLPPPSTHPPTNSCGEGLLFAARNAHCAPWACWSRGDEQLFITTASSRAGLRHTRQQSDPKHGGIPDVEATH